MEGSVSRYKRIFIDKDPAYADVREEAGRQAWAHIGQFEFRIAWNRKNKLASSPCGTHIGDSR